MKYFQILGYALFGVAVGIMLGKAIAHGTSRTATVSSPAPSVTSNIDLANGGKIYLEPGPCPPDGGGGHVFVNGIDMGCSMTGTDWRSTPDDPRPHWP
jgi:hypothetical protein